MDARGWCDLPPDLVREISGRLHHDAVDLARFHAVCKPWRDSRTATGTDQFLPWLVAAVKEDTTTRLEMRCVLSGSNYRSQPLVPEPWGNWVTSSGGTAFRCLTIESLRPSLHDPLTGAVEHLPLLPHALGLWEKEINPRGVIYGDGATLLYSVSYSYAKADHYGHGRVNSTASFRMALLRPGDAHWTLVDRTLEHHSYWSRHEIDLSCVTYHHGKIVIVMKADDWRLVTPSSNISGAHTTKEQTSVVFGEPAYNYNYNYVLESRGEILWVSIKIPEFRRYRPRHDPYFLDVSVSVQALEESAPEKTRWVRRDGRSLADRVLFLGTCHSLVVDAWRVPNGHGGCAYFVYQYNDAYTHGKRVFRCNLIDGKNELVQRLPQCWDYMMCLWFNPESISTPPQENSKGSSSKKQQQIDPTISSPPRHVIHVERHCVPSFRVLVRNLPLTVKSTQLRLFFSEHGKVSSAEVIFYKKTGASQGIGYVTIQMTHARQEDALAALNQLVLDGCHLKVSLIKQGEPPQRRRQNR